MDEQSMMLEVAGVEVVNSTLATTVVRQIFSPKKEKAFFFDTIFSKLKKHINNFFFLKKHNLVFGMC